MTIRDLEVSEDGRCSQAASRVKYIIALQSVISYVLNHHVNAKTFTIFSHQTEKIWHVWTVSGMVDQAKPGSAGKDKDQSDQDEKPASKPPTGNVVITVYGEKDKSDEMIPLVAESDDLFTDGKTDKFEVTSLPWLPSDRS